jgi:alkylation response protein AidB-like acyl-CoA dehydrogenase
LNVLPSQADEAFRAEARAWLERVMPEVWGNPAGPVVTSEEDEYAMRLRYDKALYRDGWAGLTWPREYGGRGGTLTQHRIFAEEAGRARAPEVLNRGGIGVMGPTIISCGTEAQRERYLPRILASDEMWCQGFSEPNAGSDLAGITTRAVEVDGGWTVHGQKTWTTLAHLADFCMLLARTSDEPKKHNGLTMLIVPMEQAAITTRPIRQLIGDREFSEVFFDGAFVPRENVLGEVGGGWKVALVTLGHERSTHFINRQIRLRREVDELTALVHAHRAQVSSTLVDRLVDVRVRAEALTWTVHSHIARFEAGGHAGPPDSASKVYWSDIWQALAALAVDVEAELGLPVDQPDRGEPDWTMRYLAARPATIYAGTSEIQKGIIGDRGLGLPR